MVFDSFSMACMDMNLDAFDSPMLGEHSTKLKRYIGTSEPVGGTKETN